MNIVLTVNGRRHVLDVGPDRTLLSVLREELALTGTKYGCGEGECGACTVLLGDESVHSCSVLAGRVAGRPITTIEGLERDGRLHPVQAAFVDEQAMQCGYCTPGMIMRAVALLRAVPAPDDERIVAELEGNVCRCGTYPRIVAAVKRAAAGRTAERTAGEGRP